jgi:hypothetical protein
MGQDHACEEVHAPSGKHLEGPAVKIFRKDMRALFDAFWALWASLDGMQPDKGQKTLYWCAMR